MRKLNFDNQNCYCRVLLSVVDSKNRHKIEPYFEIIILYYIIFGWVVGAKKGTQTLKLSTLVKNNKFFIFTSYHIVKSLVYILKIFFSLRVNKVHIPPKNKNKSHFTLQCCPWYLGWSICGREFIYS